MTHNESTMTEDRHYHHLEGRVGALEAGVLALAKTVDANQKENKADFTEIKEGLSKLTDRGRLDGGILIAAALGIFTVLSGVAYAASLYVDNAIAPVRTSQMFAREWINDTREKFTKHEQLDGHPGMSSRINKLEAKLEAAGETQLARASRDTELETFSKQTDDNLKQRLDELKKQSEIHTSDNSAFHAAVLERLRSLESHSKN